MFTLKYRDPSPSLLRYRFERFWLKSSVRRAVKLWLPLAVFGVVIWNISEDPSVQTKAQIAVADLRSGIAALPQLQVTGVVYPNISAALRAQIETVLPLQFPLSSLDIDVAHLQAVIEKLDAVDKVNVTILADGVLKIQAIERTPDMVWRDGNTLRLVDREGNRVSEIARRAARPDLALVAGTGAEKALPEARALIEVLMPLNARLRGLVRVGERRWNVSLDRGQTIMLPEFGAITALKRVLELDASIRILDRDVTIIDMRNTDRPVLRLGSLALVELQNGRIPEGGQP